MKNQLIITFSILKQHVTGASRMGIALTLLVLLVSVRASDSPYSDTGSKRASGERTTAPKNGAVGRARNSGRWKRAIAA